MKTRKNIKDSNTANQVTRKQALKKIASVTALTAASVFFLSTKASAADSAPTAPPGW